MATKWEGRERLRKRFNRLPDLAKNYVRDAMAQGADEIVAMQKRIVEKDDGDLAKAIHWEWRKAATGAVMVLRIVGGNAKVWWGRFVEFGTKPHRTGGRFPGAMHPGTPARPFFYSSYRALKRRVMNRIRRGFRKAVAASKSS